LEIRKNKIPEVSAEVDTELLHQKVKYTGCFRRNSKYLLFLLKHPVYDYDFGFIIHTSFKNHSFEKQSISVIKQSKYLGLKVPLPKEPKCQYYFGMIYPCVEDILVVSMYPLAQLFINLLAPEFYI